MATFKIWDANFHENGSVNHLTFSLIICIKKVLWSWKNCLAEISRFWYVCGCVDVWTEGCRKIYWNWNEICWAYFRPEEIYKSCFKFFFLIKFWPKLCNFNKSCCFYWKTGMWAHLRAYSLKIGVQCWNYHTTTSILT